VDTPERWAKEVARVVFQSFRVAPFGFDVRVSPDRYTDTTTLATVPSDETWPGECILANVQGADFADAFPYLAGGVDLTWHISHHTSEAEFVASATPLLASRLAGASADREGDAEVLSLASV
jgi:hypothetical protein